MANSTKPRKPQPRFLDFTALAGGNAFVNLTVGKLAVSYFLEEVPADFGRGFAVEKVNGERYHVHVEAGGSTTCDCPGGNYHGHCKHQDAIRKLIDLGKLPTPQLGMAPVAA